MTHPVELEARVARKVPLTSPIVQALPYLLLICTRWIGWGPVVTTWLALALARRWWRPRATTLRIDDAGVHSGANLLAQRDQIASVHTEPVEGGHKVTLVVRSAVFDPAIVVTDEQLPAVLDALGRGGLPPRIRCHVGWLALTPKPVRFLLLALLIAAFLGGGTWALLLLLPFIVTTTTALVDVGSDGVSTSWFGFHRFVPYANVESISAGDVTKRRIELRFHDGGTLTLQVSEGTRVDAIAERIQQGIADARSGAKSATVELPREIERLRRLEESATYREAAPDRDALWRIVEDAGADRPTRARAAIALSSSLDGGERVRLRVMADTTASPRMRIALDTAAKATEEAELEAALADVEREAPAAGSKPDALKP